LLLDNDAFSSFTTVPNYSQTTVAGEDTVSEVGRSSRRLLGRKGTAVLNKVLPRSLRMKRWASTPSLPKLQSSSPSPVPRIPTGWMSPPAGTPVPANSAFDYDPYEDKISDDEDEEESRRPTTRGTMMSREQLPTPPFLPSTGCTLPHIPSLDSFISVSSPATSAHHASLSNSSSYSTQYSQSTRNNSLTSTYSLPPTPVPSTTYVSPSPRPVDPSLQPSTLSLTRTHEDSLQDLLQQMQLEDNAFAATEQRMATTGWSTEAELVELGEKRALVRKEWEERIASAKTGRRASESGSLPSMFEGNGATPVITLLATAAVSPPQ
jgi:hypothetical protein